MHSRYKMGAIDDQEITRSPSGSRSASVTASIWATTLTWVSSTPLGACWCRWCRSASRGRPGRFARRRRNPAAPPLTARPTSAPARARPLRARSTRAPSARAPGFPAPFKIRGFGDQDTAAGVSDPMLGLGNGERRVDREGGRAEMDGRRVGDVELGRVGQPERDGRRGTRSAYSRRPLIAPSAVRSAGPPAGSRSNTRPRPHAYHSAITSTSATTGRYDDYVDPFPQVDCSDMSTLSSWGGPGCSRDATGGISPCRWADPPNLRRPFGVGGPSRLSALCRRATTGSR